VTAKKSSKIFRDFWQLPTLIANISGTDQHIKKSEKLLIIYTLSHVRPKNLAYFGRQTKKLLTLINVHPNGFFRETISRPLGDDAPWRGPPPPKKNRENLKFALKFSVLESITSGIVEVFSLNFFMWPAIMRKEFCLPELILHSYLRRRAASRLALSCPSSLVCCSSLSKSRSSRPKIYLSKSRSSPK